MSSQAPAVSTTKIYTPQFWLLCTSSFLFFASFNMLIPELPAYLTSLGGEEHKGLIISLFTMTALISRPFSGKLADWVGRVPVMIIGSLVCVVVSLLYPLLTTVSGFLALRFVHGFSTGFAPTGRTAYLADIVPAERRGEAMGYIGTASSLGMASGPPLGGAIANLSDSIDFLFYSASALALISILVLAGIKESLPHRNKFSLEWADLFELRVWKPCVVIVCLVFGYGAMLTVVPDFSEHVGITNKGLLFTFFPIASLVARVVGGKASDKYGRVAVLRISSFLTIAAMMLMATGSIPWQLALGMALFGFSHGLTSPTLFAWTTDLSNPAHRGRGIASLYIFLELGIGVGAFTSGLVFNNNPANFFATFLICAVFAGAAFVFLLLDAIPFKRSL